MKKVVSIILSMTIFTFLNSFSVKPVEKERIEIIFTNQLKYADLVAIKENLLEKGIFIEYRRLEFDRKKHLKSIDFFVDCKDGFSGSASTSKFTKDKKFGFYRDYNETSVTHFFSGFFK